MDEKALKALTAICRQEAWRRFRRMTRLRAVVDIDDAQQEAMLHGLLAHRSFDEESRVPYGAWVCTWVRWRLANWHRGLIGGRSRSKPVAVVSIHEPLNEDGLTLEDMLAAAGSPVEQWAAQAKTEQVFLNITTRERDILEYTYADGATIVETAEKMGLTPQSVFDLKRWALARARQDLKPEEKGA